ncbi:MAG: oligopeptide ABC transporter permease [Lachnospirales bacterium]
MSAIKKTKIDKIESPMSIIRRKFFKSKIAVIAMIILSILILAVIFAPFLTPYSPEQLNPANANKPPSVEHLLGTDYLGRDYLTRVLYGGRISLQVGLFAVCITVTIGTLVGGVAGYYGGKIDTILMRIAEIFLSLPFFPLAITISAVVGTRLPGEYKMYITMMVIGLLGWPSLSRIIRGQILSLREQEFMQAATALGLSDRKKIFKHLIPNVFGYIIVSATLGIASAILTESALSYLGLGVVPPTATWGNMISIANDSYILMNRPWLWIPPGLCIFLTVMCVNIIGDALRDAIDPKSKEV